MILHPQENAFPKIPIPANTKNPILLRIKNGFLKKAAKTVANNTESDIIRNEIGFQFFANRGISKQSDKQLQKSIASWERQIAEHEDKIANPRNHDSNWDNMNEIQRQGEINHWKKEIRSHRKNIEEAQAELRRRKND